MQKLPILLLLLAAVNQEGGAFCVYNEQSRSAVVKIDGIYKENFAAGEKKCCNWKDCGGSREKVLIAWITTNGMEHGIFSQAGGCIHIKEDKTDWNWPKNSSIAGIVQSVSYKIDPGGPGYCTWEKLDYEPYISTGGSRSVHFLATADTQYWVDKNRVKAVPDQTIATMVKLLSSQYDRRGFVLAGDLVERADYWWNNFYAYESAFFEFARYLFDGVGNHDLHNGVSGSVENILSTIRGRNRVTVTNMRAGPSTPDYSWNWDDVHFVQLNNYPGSPGYGLAWLKSDLESNVGGSGNPIVMIHHYGFDEFSRQPRWWKYTDQKNYWDIIKGYNVIACITGHLHDPYELLAYWEGDDYLNGAKIPYFIAGAAMQDGCDGRGCFLEVTIKESQLTVVQRNGNDGSERARASVGLKPTKKKPLAAESQAIFEDIPRDGSILTIYPNPAVNQLHVDVIENNTELVEGVEIFDRNGKLFDVPGPYPANQLNFSISQLPPLAVYLLRVKMAGGRIEQRKFWKSTDEEATGDP